MSSQGRLRWIYFLRRADGAIKIGRSVNPRRRLTALGGLSALEFLGAYMGDGSDEVTVHRQFEASKLAGEWFQSTPELEAFIRDTAQCDWESLQPITKATRLSALPRENKKTFGFSLNTRNPVEAQLRIWLEKQPNPSAVIKRALIGVMQAAGGAIIQTVVEAPVRVDDMTSQERGQLVATIASLQQQLELAQRKAAAAPVPAVSAETPTAAAPASSGPALRPEFIAAVKAAAKPGIRLEDVQHGS